MVTIALTVAFDSCKKGLVFDGDNLNGPRKHALHSKPEKVPLTIVEMLTDLTV